jgi:RNA polymerase sigma-70 factor (ECF subfamily)
MRIDTLAAIPVAPNRGIYFRVTCNRPPAGGIPRVMSQDHDIVSAVLERRAGAFEKLVNRHQALVWHLVYRLVRHPEDARELCQDVFLRVHDRLHQYRFESSLATWIGRVAFSVATRHLQKKRLPLVSMEADDGEVGVIDQIGDGFDLEAACMDSELMRYLVQAIDRLPPLQRMLVTLYHLDELPIAEIARIADLPEGTVKNYLFRARHRLRQQLDIAIGEPA